jgi:hypothetical protein
MGLQCVSSLAATIAVIFRLTIEQLERARACQSSGIVGGPPIVSARL